jgi:hypothetical protein
VNEYQRWAALIARREAHEALSCLIEAGADERQRAARARKSAK